MTTVAEKPDAPAADEQQHRLAALPARQLRVGS
jgi:hypothetical protein